MYTPHANAATKIIDPDIKIERSRLLLLGALAATAMAVTGCGSAIPDGEGTFSGRFKQNNTKYIITSNANGNQYSKSHGPDYNGTMAITKEEYEKAAAARDKGLAAKYRKPKPKTAVDAPSVGGEGEGHGD